MSSTTKDWEKEALDLCRRVAEGEIDPWDADKLDYENGNDYSEFSWRCYLDRFFESREIKWNRGDKVRVRLGGEVVEGEVLAYSPLTRWWDMPTVDVVEKGCIYSGVDAGRILIP